MSLKTIYARIRFLIGKLSQVSEAKSLKANMSWKIASISFDFETSKTEVVKFVLQPLFSFSLSSYVIILLLNAFEKE